MDKVSDLFKELKDRINNPLVISFVVSWVFLNWRIFVGLFFYKSNELDVDKYKSYIDLIERNNIDHYHRATAILIAIIYTLFYPLLKQFILIFGTFFDKWGTTLSLRVVNAARVPFSEVMVEKKKNQSLQNEVTTYTNDRDNLQTTISNLRLRISEIEKEKSEEVAKVTQETNKEITETNHQLKSVYEENTELKNRINLLENSKIDFLLGMRRLIYQSGSQALIKITSDEIIYYIDSNASLSGRLHVDKTFKILEVSGNLKAIILTLQLYNNSIQPSSTKYFWRVPLQAEDGKYLCRSLNNDINEESNFTLIEAH